VGYDIYAGVPLPVGWFQAKYVGKKKMLMFRPTPSNRNQFNLANYYLPMFFPKPAIGKWQVFDALVIDVSRVPSLNSGYCSVTKSANGARPSRFQCWRRHWKGTVTSHITRCLVGGLPGRGGDDRGICPAIPGQAGSESAAGPAYSLADSH
jgi:hypothetical protein